MIRRLTVGNLLTAEKVPVACKYCKEKTSHYRRHRKTCRQLRRARRRGDLSDDDEPAPAYNRVLKFRRHKTFRGVDLPVIVDPPLYRLLKLWRSYSLPNVEDPDTPLFPPNLRWRHLLSLITRVVGKKIVDGAKLDGNIGSKAMRQYAATKFLRVHGAPHSAMARIGGSEAVARKHYQDQAVNVAEKLSEKELVLKVSSSNSSTSQDASEDSDSNSDSNTTTISDSEESASSSSSREPKRRVKGKLRPGQTAKSSGKKRKHTGESSRAAEGPAYSEGDLAATTPSDYDEEDEDVSASRPSTSRRKPARSHLPEESSTSSDEEGDSASRRRPAVSPSPEPLPPGSEEEEEDLPPRASTPLPEDYRSSSSDDLPFEVISSPTPPAPAPPSVTEDREPTQKTPEREEDD